MTPLDVKIDQPTLAFAEGLRAAHLKRPRRRDVTAISARSAAWLIAALELKAPAAVADTGSGFSTVTVRSWAARRPKWVLLHTTDTKPGWLRATEADLRDAGLSTAGMLDHAEWLTRSDRYDLIFVDHWSSAARRRDMSKIVARLEDDGWLVLDDWHFPHYAGPVTAFLEGLGFKVLSLKAATVDEYGRHLAVAWRRP